MMGAVPACPGVPPVPSFDPMALMGGTAVPANEEEEELRVILPDLCKEFYRDFCCTGWGGCFELLIAVWRVVYKEKIQLSAFVVAESCHSLFEQRGSWHFRN